MRVRRADRPEGKTSRVSEYPPANDDNLIRDIWPKAEATSPVIRREQNAASDSNLRGLELFRRGLATVDPRKRNHLFVEANAAFEGIRASVPEKSAPWLRVTINSAIALSHMDRPKQERSVALLCEVVDLLPNNPLWLLDKPRALDALGNVYARLGRIPDAIKAHKKAYDSLKHAPGRTEEWSRLKGRIASNLAADYVDSQEPEQALNQVAEALELLSLAEDSLNHARARRIEGEAHHLRAVRLNNQRRGIEALQALEQAIGVLDEVRRAMRASRHDVDWASTTATLAGAEMDLGKMLTGLAQYGPLEGLPHIRQAAKLYMEALPKLPTSTDRDTVRRYLIDTIEYLHNASKGPEDIHLEIMARIKIYDVYFCVAEYATLLSSAPLIALNAPLSFIRDLENDLKIDKMAQNSTAITGLFQSLDLSEAEARLALVGAFRQLGWSEKAQAANHTDEARQTAPGVLFRPKGDHTLPRLPSSLSWPTETYSGSPEAKRGGGGIVAYLERVWLPLLKAIPGAIDLRLLRYIDKSSASGIYNYRQKGKNLPSHLDFPTHAQVNDRALAAATISPRHASRLARAAYRRKQKRRPTS